MNAWFGVLFDVPATSFGAASAGVGRADLPGYLIALAVGGLGAGLLLLTRGLAGYRRATRIGDISTSKVAGLAAGEVRVTGRIDAAELLLTSPLQSRPCVYYRATVDEDRGQERHRVLAEERAVGFRIRDASGEIRVFPRGARWAVPEVFDEHTGLMRDEPPGLELRTGSAIAPAVLDRDAAVAELLTVHGGNDPGQGDLLAAAGGFRGSLAGSGGLLAAGEWRARHYREARLEPGIAVTVVGMAIPFGQLPDPSGADALLDEFDPTAALGDPEIAADLAEARAAGTLETAPEEAWGNAAIPGFGIGRPTRSPELDPAAAPLPIATAAEAARAERTFEIDPETLILAAAPDVPLLVAAGAPDQAVTREQDRFLLGLLGAILAIGSAVVLAYSLTGGFGS